jgi:hypothetical protein
MIVRDNGWSLGAQSHSFQERGVLELIGHNLKRVYGEPKNDTLPERLRELIAKLERAERDLMPASEG